MKYENADPADVLETFKGRGITVQTTRPIQVKARTIAGKSALGPGYETKSEPLSVAHILSAKRWDDGSVSITTIDGCKYEAGA